MKYKIIKFLFLIFIFQGYSYCGFYSSGSPKEKTFSLTYDDGPAPLSEKLIALLKEKKAPAAFFFLGERIAMYPQIAKKISDAGFEIGNHTYSHKNFYSLDKKSADKEKILIKEIELFEKEAQKAGLPKSKLLRMPNGFSKPWAQKIIFSKGYNLVNWTFGADWLKISEENLTSQYLKALKPGAIILLHDGGKDKEKTVRITKAILEEAEKKGLKPVALSELLKIK